jgi:hypothetical protein
MTLRSKSKPVILVLVNGGQVAIDEAVDNPVAIVEAFHSNGIGGTALAMSLFGLENRWGKLPYTIYPYSTMGSFDMKDYSMSTPREEATNIFGFSLLLAAFETPCSIVKDDSLQFECSI